MKTWVSVRSARSRRRIVSLKIVCIFLLVFSLYAGLAIVGLAYENLQLRHELAKTCGGRG